MTDGRERETGGAYARAIEEAAREFAAGVPRVMAQAAGVEYREAPAGGGVFTVPYMDSVLEVAHPEGSVREAGAEAVVAVTIVVLHYLARSVGPLDLAEPVRFQGLPGAGAYTAAFRSHAEVPLLQRFGEDGEAYVRALTALGGRPAQEVGPAEDSRAAGPEAAGGARAADREAAEAARASDPEAVWTVPFLPHLPLGVRLGLAEDAMPADCVIMFPRRAGFAYHVEDLAVAGELLSARVLAVAEMLGASGTEDDLEVLATFFDPTEADLVVGKLRSAGIDAIVLGDALSVVYGLTMEGHARHHVLVRPEDLVEARGALDPEGPAGGPSPEGDEPAGAAPDRPAGAEGAARGG